MTIKDLLTFAMDRRLDESYTSEQWTLAHYSSRERLINESEHKLSACSALHDGETEMVRQCCLIDSAHTLGSLCRCCVAADSARLIWARSISSFSGLDPCAFNLDVSLIYLQQLPSCTYIQALFVYISRIYLYPSKKVIGINTRPPCVSICSLPFALA